jgi:hypothetical protein
MYIMADVSGMLYTGVTNYLERRVAGHKQKLRDGFAKKYDVTRLVYERERRRAELGMVIPVGQAEAHPWLGLFDTNGNVHGIE